jgi:hypothetical protein
MGRKNLQDVANTLPKMLVGWRMHEDLEQFAEIPNGRLTIDLLRRVAVHDVAGTLQLHIVDELAAWLAQKLAAEQIPVDELSSVTLEADIRSDRVATDKKRIVLFDFNCRCSVVTLQRRYEGTLCESLKWHQRIGA